jgi:hypothetical protein
MLAILRPAPGDGVPASPVAAAAPDERPEYGEEIAQRLVVSDAAITRHVARLVRANRVQAVVLAYECGFVRPAGSLNGAGR